MAAHNELGKWGEDLAVLYLQDKGYLIAGRNWRSGRHEVDIIAIDGDEYVFVEVKTRSTDYLEPMMAVNSEKIRSIDRAAYGYVRYYRINNPIRYDVITIIAIQGSEPVIKHYENAFHPGAHIVHKKSRRNGGR